LIAYTVQLFFEGKSVPEFLSVSVAIHMIIAENNPETVLDISKDA
jgi:hypothetical protein